MSTEDIAIELAGHWLALRGKYRNEVDPDEWIRERERIVEGLIPAIRKLRQGEAVDGKALVDILWSE